MEKAKWIWQNTQNEKDEYVHFIDEFTVASGDGVKLKISCDSDYTVYVNGSLAAFGQYADYPYYKVYDEVDITRYSKKGKNHLAICAYYIGETFSTYYKGKAGLIYEVYENNNIIAYSSEKTKCRLATDYISHRMEKITVQLGFGYSYNMAGYDGWNLPGYDYSSFGNSVVIENMPKDFHIRPVKKTKLGQLRAGKPIKYGYFTDKGGETEAKRQQRAQIVYEANVNGDKITVNNGDGIYALYDLGCEEVGFLYFKMRTKEKTKIGIGYGEHIADGKVRTSIDYRNFAVEYLSIEGEQEFLNSFRRFGARYIQIFADTKEIEIENIGLIPVFYPLTKKEFKTDDPLRQKIYDVSVRTLELCMHEHYEDCPWREQALYTLDSRNQMLCGYFAFKETEMAMASLRLIGLDGRDDGLLSICYPCDVNLAIPSFSLYYIIQMYEYLHYTEDDSLAKEFYGKMEEILSVFIKRMENSLVPIFEENGYWNFYEWNEGLDGFGERSERFDVILNSLFSLALFYMSEISKRLGKEERAEYYLNLRERVNEAIDNAFFDRESGLYRTRNGEAVFSELANSLAVLCGAADKEKSEKIAKELTNYDSDMIKATLSMQSFKYDALISVDKAKYKDYILNDIDRNYSYMLERGATSFWETIKGESDFDGAGSLCHGWSAIPVYYYHLLLK